MPTSRHSVTIKEEPVWIPYSPLDDGDTVIVSTPNIIESETVRVRLLKNLIVKVIGGVTGKEYVFNGAGSTVDVDKSDIESINKKNIIHKSCCGNYNSSPYFEIL